MKHLLNLQDSTKKEIASLISLAQKIKKNPKKYRKKLYGKTLLMMFEKPSLRTRVSFEVAMNQMGGSAVVIDSQNTPFKEKESIADTAKVSSRYCDGIMARLFSQHDMNELAENATVPVINGLTDLYHPCQILSDLLTLTEKKKKLKGITVAFVGDGNNNITHSLLLGCTTFGINIHVASPKSMMPNKEIVASAKKKTKRSKSKILITTDPKKAVENTDVVYADSWMSYHISDKEKESRFKILKKYQITKKLMKLAKKNAFFMNCLPAQRGAEQTAEVIDGKSSIVIDQAENRLHMQKAILMTLIK